MSGFNLASCCPSTSTRPTSRSPGSTTRSCGWSKTRPTRRPCEAFRMFHSIKGASVVMGFTPVKRLTHHLESLFEQLRSRKRTLDRPTLDLSFRCLDGLRDYHRDLRAAGQSEVDLSGLTQLVEAALHDGPRRRRRRPRAVTDAGAERRRRLPAGRSVGPLEEPSGIALTVVFEPGLPWPT